MLRKPCLRILVLALVSAVFPVCYLAAQESQDAPSVAEAAKRAREKKEAATAKPANVITNDQIPSVSPADATALNAPQATTSSGDASSDKNAAAGAAGDEKKNAEIDALKKELKDKQEALNLLQRELSLDRDNFFSNPDYQRDVAGKQKLDDLQANLDGKQNELNELKAKLTELAGADALKAPAKEEAPANPPAAPQQQ
jgi:predicted RNase H-like nuclease (RuvC/YqgF family)